MLVCLCLFECVWFFLDEFPYIVHTFGYNCAYAFFFHCLLLRQNIQSSRCDRWIGNERNIGLCIANACLSIALWLFQWMCRCVSTLHPHTTTFVTYAHEIMKRRSSSEKRWWLHRMALNAAINSWVLACVFYLHSLTEYIHFWDIKKEENDISVSQLRLTELVKHIYVQTLFIQPPELIFQKAATLKKLTSHIYIMTPFYICSIQIKSTTPFEEGTKWTEHLCQRSRKEKEKKRWSHP